MSSGPPASIKRARELFDPSGRTAIITGGLVGLGRQMAEGLAEMGANLVLCARKKERCVQAAEELQKLGVKTLALGCDVKNPTDVHAVVDASLAAFGRIDVLNQDLKGAAVFLASDASDFVTGHVLVADGGQSA